MTTPWQTTQLPPGRLGPMSLGEILDRALQLFRSNFTRLLTLMLIFEAPIYALGKVLQVQLYEKVPVLARPASYRGEPISLEQLGWAAGVLLAGLVGVLILYQLAVATLTSAGARAFLGERVEVRAALCDTLRRAPHLLGTWLALLLWTTLLVVVAAAPGLGIGIAGVALSDSPGVRLTLALVGGLLGLGLATVAGLYVMLRYALVVEVVMVERLEFVAALRRCARLMAGRVGPTAFDSCMVRASVVLAVNLAISLSVMVVTSLPGLLVNAAFGASSLNPESYDPTLVPLWASVPVEVFQVLMQSAVAPFGLLAMVVFYFDVRIKREGYDLELLASRLGDVR